MPEPVLISSLSPREKALCVALANTIANYRPESSHMFDNKTLDLLDTDEVHAKPLLEMGWVIDKQALDFARASKTQRARALKNDPTLKNRAVFILPQGPAPDTQTPS